MSSEKASTRDHVAEFPTVGTAGTKTFDKPARGSSNLVRVIPSRVNAWKSGVRDVVFPPGTWWMRVHHGAVINLRADAG